MKKVFQKDFKNWRTMMFLFCLIVIFSLALWNLNRTNIFLLLLLYIPLISIYFRKYTIEEDGNLSGNGVIPIENIEKIVYEPHRTCRRLLYEPDWITIYYLETKDGKTKVRKYYPKDADGFIQSLTALNPSIQVA